MSTSEEFDPVKKDPSDMAAEAAGEDRRDFLTRSSALLGILTAMGLAETPFAHAAEKKKIKLTKEQQTALNKTFDTAIDTGDIKKALDQHGAGLPEDVKTELSKLTPEDLKMMADLRKKLQVLREKVADNNGYAGM